MGWTLEINETSSSNLCEVLWFNINIIGNIFIDLVIIDSNNAIKIAQL